MTHKKKKIIKKGTKRSRKKGKKTYSFKNRFFYISTFLILIFLGFGFFHLKTDNKTTIKVKTTKIQNDKSTKDLMVKMKKMLDEQNLTGNKLKKVTKLDINKTEKIYIYAKEDVDKNLSKKKIELKRVALKNTEIKEIKKHNFSEIHDYQKSLKFEKEIENRVEKDRKYSGKPKLAIIIDDVSFASQVRLIKRIPFKVTPSFFPPTKLHPDTVKLSRMFKFSMLHLPLEAVGHTHPEPKTLLVRSSKGDIEKRIKELKREFPEIHYYNNHTGSRFTANSRVMGYLISCMKDENLHFVDSRTTIKTKAGKVSRDLHIRLLSRDVFLDNVAKPREIIVQLKKAVKLAKKSGYAIAIGHPHRDTLKTLMGAKRYLGDVDLVYVDEL